MRSASPASPTWSRKDERRSCMVAFIAPTIAGSFYPHVLAMRLSLRLGAAIRAYIDALNKICYDEKA